jgi:hypothetical protein
LRLYWILLWLVVNVGNETLRTLYGNRHWEWHLRERNGFLIGKSSNDLF